MLVVGKGLKPAEAALVVGLVKVSSIIGTYLGGLSSDKVGLKFTMLVSFFLTALGLGYLPIPTDIFLITLFAIVAQIGHAMFPSAVRLMLSEILGEARLKEGIGWFRFANNLGQIVSYVISATFAYLGIMFFFYFDAVTTVAALILGFKILPDVKPAKVARGTDYVSTKLLFSKSAFKNKDIFLFILSSVIVALSLLMFEMITIGVAAKSRLVFGDHALKLYSLFMVINTVLCALFAIPASKYFRNIKPVFYFSTVMLVSAGILSLHNTPTELSIFLGSFLMTMGEIVFASMSQYSLLILTPENSHRGTFYSVSLMLQKTGVIIAGFITMPLLVYGNYAIATFAVVGILTVLLTTILVRNLNLPSVKEKYGHKLLFIPPKKINQKNKKKIGQNEVAL